LRRVELDKFQLPRIGRDVEQAGYIARLRPQRQQPVPREQGQRPAAVRGIVRDRDAGTIW
jgi:hypothetical protein